jgi:type I restriction enzyme S subunit
MFGNPETNTMGWEKVVLADLSVKFRYGTSTRCTSEPKGLPVLRIPNIVLGEVDLSDLKYAELPVQEIGRLLLEYGDLLFVRTNGNRNYVGRCAIFDLEAPYLFASYLIRARLHQDRVDPWYLRAYLHTSLGRQAISSFIRTTAGQSNISLEGLRQIPILLPDLPMQRRFRVYTEHLSWLRQKREKSGNSIDTTFSCLLHRAFSGDLTAKWRNAHTKELLAEMEQQATHLAVHEPQIK